MLDPRIEQALDLCYEAVETPEVWMGALDGLSAAAGAAAAMFYPKDVNDGAAEQAISSDYVGLIQDYVENGWYENHYRAERGWPLLQNRRKTVILEHDLATDEERRRSPHYNDLYLKWGFSGFVAVGFHVEGQPWCVPMLRSVRQGFFTRDDADRLAALGPHFARMIRLSESAERLRASRGLDALSLLGKPAFLLDPDGRIAEMNTAARALLAEQEGGLVESRGRLRATEAQSDRRLRQLVSTIRIFSHRLQRASQVLPVRIERPGRRPLLAEIVSAGRLVRGFAFRPQALLLVTDPEQKIRLKAERLSAAFGLTPAEARFAAHLADGQDIAEAAAAVGVMRSTARDRLKSIFLKTDTHRQAELVVLLRNLAE